MKQLFGETDGIRGKANSYPLDVKTMVELGRALAEYVKQTVKANPNRPYKVIIGKDTRRSGYMVEQAIASGLTSRGIDVVTIGPIPTPGLSHLVKSFALDLGIQITASHNPYTDNGVKVFNNNGKKLTDKQELAIEDIFFKNDYSEQIEVGMIKHLDDGVGRYIEFIKSIAGNISLSGMSIVVDCANGAAYKTAPTVFEELGAKVIPISVSPDGFNINKECGVLHPEHVRDAVIANKADLGIALDGDADRVYMIDELGHIIDGDYIIALLAKEFKTQGTLAKDTVVVTQYSNLALIENLKESSINVDNSIINGDRWISEMCEKEGYNFGGEQTGHFILTNYADTGDGTMAALIVLKIMHEQNKKLSEIAYTFEKYPQTKTAINVKQKLPLESIPGFSELNAKWEKTFNGQGRSLIRYSGTENILRILVEAKNKELLEKCHNEYNEFLIKSLT